MALLGFRDSETEDLMSVVAAVIHMGNIGFSDADDGTAHLDDPEALAMVSRLLLVDQNRVLDALTTTQMTMRSETITKAYDADKVGRLGCGRLPIAALPCFLAHTRAPRP